MDSRFRGNEESDFCAMTSSACAGMPRYGGYWNRGGPVDYRFRGNER